MGYRRGRRPAPCPAERVEEVTKLLISNDYVPFSWGNKSQSGNRIVRLDTSKHGKDWLFDYFIWLHKPSLPKVLRTSDNIIDLNLDYL